MRTNTALALTFLGYLIAVAVQGLITWGVWNVSVLARVFGPLTYLESLATFLVIRILWKGWPFDRVLRLLRVFFEIEL